MPRKTQTKSKPHKDITLESYEHTDKKRKNNPAVGLVTSQTDKTEGKTKYQYDPYIDPSLQWAGKAERVSFDVPNISLHVHERIDPKTIAKSFIKEKERSFQPSLFDEIKEVPLSKAVHFYSHEEQWANRLIAGDSLAVMNSLLYKEGMAGKVQMVFIDPPYGIKYNSNFQPFTNKRDVKDGNDADIPGEPETIKAFRDTWELEVHSYLTYLRDRLLLSKELMHNDGSCFVQISDENVHHVRELMDEVFGKDNFVSQIKFFRAGAQTTKFLADSGDYIIWYSKNKKTAKFRQLYVDDGGWVARAPQKFYEFPDGEIISTKKTTDRDIKKARIFSTNKLESASYSEASRFPVEFEGKVYEPKRGWSTNPQGMENLKNQNRLIATGNTLRWKVYVDDFPFSIINNNWLDTSTGFGAEDKLYVVQTTTKVIQRLMLMVTDPGDLVFDPTCGSGTTAYVAEEWGRRWITCDTSRVAITLARQRLMTSNFDYLALAHPEEGIRSGFEYKKYPHITLRSIANNESPTEEVLYDQPLVIKDVVRSTGPFTVEAVPSIRVKPFDGNTPNTLSDKDLAKTGDTALYQRWIDELKTTGIRAIGGKMIEFARVSHKEGSAYIHAEADVRDGNNLFKTNIVFGGEFGPLEQRQVELALKETMNEKERASYLIFAAFQFDPEASKDIDQIEIEGLTVLKAQMNVDLLTEDLRKKRSSNQSYWLIGQPAIEVLKADGGKYQVQVKGFDYYNPATGETDSAGINRIAMWMLDTDYDERTVFPTQVFFPQGDANRDWTKLAKALNGTVDEDLLEFFSSDTSLPFKSGNNRKIAVKIVDDRGVESLVIKELK